MQCKRSSSSSTNAYPVSMLGHDEQQLHDAVVKKAHQQALFQVGAVVTSRPCVHVAELALADSCKGHGSQLDALACL